MDALSSSPQPPRHVRYLFWALLGSLSAYLAEVPSGSFPWPFFHPWGVLVVCPLYTLHTLLLAWLVFRFGPPRLSTLYLAGGLFGLYEAYITKVIWLPFWQTPEDVVMFAGIAIWETIVIMFVWHPIMSFVLPLLVGESQCTATREVGRAMPRLLRGRWLTPRKRIATVCAFGLCLGLFLSGAMKVSPLVILAACVLSAAVPLGLIRLLRGRYSASQYSMRSLLPREREVKVLAGILLFYYLWMGILIRPEIIPASLKAS